jgi:hypothetical protein
MTKTKKQFSTGKDWIGQGVQIRGADIRGMDRYRRWNSWIKIENGNLLLGMIIRFCEATALSDLNATKTITCSMKIRGDEWN